VCIFQTWSCPFSRGHSPWRVGLRDTVLGLPRCGVLIHLCPFPQFLYATAVPSVFFWQAISFCCGPGIPGLPFGHVELFATISYFGPRALISLA